jgi:DNA-binding CsgD family transcriptional regulator
VVWTLDDYRCVLDVKSKDELADSLLKFTHSMGFQKYAALTVEESGADKQEIFVSLDNTPPEFYEHYMNLEDSRRDPVLRHLKRSSLPISWSQDNYVNAGAADLWEKQQPYGYSTGLAVALHLPGGKHFIVTMDRDQALPTDKVEMQRLAANIQLFAVHAQDSAMRLMVPETKALRLPSLTPREMEALRWTIDGKTAWEVGMIMGVSERTAVMHLSNATKKLECVNKHQAAVKALRLGVIT